MKGLSFGATLFCWYLCASMRLEKVRLGARREAYLRWHSAPRYRPCHRR